MSAFHAIEGLLTQYFDGLYFGDVAVLKQVFHQGAQYISAQPDDHKLLTMAEYFAWVAARTSPSELNETRHDAILSIEFAGNALALAQVKCAITGKLFTDLLTIIFIDGRWQIIAKAFQYQWLTQPPKPLPTTAIN